MNKPDVHKIAMERFDRVSTDERDQRDKSIDDTMFAQVEGAQYDEESSKKRKDRPKLEINKIALPINQAIGDQRQSRISIKVRPTKTSNSQDISKTFDGLIRNIENNSNFNNVKNSAYKDIVNGGMAAWYITTDFNDDDSFEQDIFIKKITSPASSVFMESSSKDENKKDAMWGFVVEEIPEEVFKNKYPNAIISDVNTNTQAGTFRQGWRTQNTVRIADYWVKEQITKEIALMTDNSVIEINKKTKTVLDELKQQGITIAQDSAGNEKRRKVKSNKVVHYKVSGAEILNGPNEWASKYIPIVMIYGYDIWINSMHYWRGMVRQAKDPQRAYNYATSQAIETTALSPKDPIWITHKQAQGKKRQFEEFPLKNNPFMFYNPDPLAPGPPQRSGAPALQQSLIQQIQQADIDIQATTGRFSPSLGDNPADQSGRAVIAVQQQGEAGTFELSDNLAGAVAYTGEILIDLIPKIYDTSRQISVLKDDDEVEVFEINKTIIDQQTGKKVILNDLSLGKYSVEVDVGPSYKTQRTESLNFLNSLSQNSPVFAQLAPDLLAKNVDFEYSEELTKRIRKFMLTQGLIEPNEQEAEEIKRNQANQQPGIMEKMQIKNLELELEQKAVNIDKNEAEVEKMQAETANKIADTQKKLVDIEKTKADTSKILSETETEIPVNHQELEAYDANLEALNDSIVNLITEPQDIVTPDVNEGNVQPEGIQQQQAELPPDILNNQGVQNLEEQEII